jgi:hypothetical protein
MATVSPLADGLLAARLKTKSRKKIVDHKVIFLTITNAVYSLFRTLSRRANT